MVGVDAIIWWIRNLTHMGHSGTVNQRGISGLGGTEFHDFLLQLLDLSLCKAVTVVERAPLSFTCELNFYHATACHAEK